MRQLSGQDGVFLHAESTGLPLHIQGLTIYNPATAPGGKFSYEQLVHLFQERIHLARVFHQRLVEVPPGMDQPYWIEVSVLFPLESLGEVIAHHCRTVVGIFDNAVSGRGLFVVQVVNELRENLIFG